MSYLNLTQGIPGFNKAVISFWFRVPKESLDQLKDDTQAEIAEAEGNPFHTFPRLHRIMPLVTFGQLFEGYILDAEAGPTRSYNFNTWGTPADTWVQISTESRTTGTGAVLVNKAPQPINPSLIGISYDGDRSEEEGGGSHYRFFVYLQTQDRGGTGLYKLDRFTSNDINTGFPSGAAVDTVPYENHWDSAVGAVVSRAPAPGNPHITRGTVEDSTEEWMGQGGPDSFSSLYDIEVEPDTWHHALISFDLDNGTSTEGPFAASTSGDAGSGSSTVDNSVSDPCQLWIAFDDENHNNQTDLDPDLAVNLGLKGSNDWLSRYSQQAYFAPGGSSKSIAWGIAGVVEDFSYDGGPAGRYTFPASQLPSSGFAFGIPAGANMAEHIRICEMAEFQMWTGVTMDTGDINNRRAFVDDNGKPVDPLKGIKADPATATQADSRGPGERLLGKPPEILLHGSSKWQEGYNTGTLGVEINSSGEVTKIPSGQFTPTAKIEKYKPEPALTETPTA